MAKRIAFGLISLIIGAFAIVVLIGVGEATTSGILAYAIISISLALLAFVLSRPDPKGGPIYALIACAPVTFISFSSGGGDYILAAFSMITIALLGALLGSRRPTARQEPPSTPPPS